MTADIDDLIEAHFGLFYRVLSATDKMHLRELFQKLRDIKRKLQQEGFNGDDVIAQVAFEVEEGKRTDLLQGVIKLFKEWTAAEQEISGLWDEYVERYPAIANQMNDEDLE